jgi:hypothetical protein
MAYVTFDALSDGMMFIAASFWRSVIESLTSPYSIKKIILLAG